MRTVNIRSIEDKLLAPYAMKSYKSKGRAYPEKEHAYRSAYQRDRDRIIHSAAFRRLEYKTQVFVNHEGDYYRTRLTHTLEVAQIARTIAQALGLNSDLVEAIALAHDLGHTPFGHAGEDALNELMVNFGGFNHNLQGLRVVDKLEERYVNFPGLNLTWELREGIVRHSTAFDHSTALDEFSSDTNPTLETQVVDIADEIAYDNHDIDDGLTSGLLREGDLKTSKLWHKISIEILRKYGKIDEDKKKYLAIRSLIDIQVTDLIKETKRRLDNIRPRSPFEAKNTKEKIVAFSRDMVAFRKPLRGILVERLYKNYRVNRMSSKAKRFIEELYRIYINQPQQLPPVTIKHAEEDGIERAVCDYIAGMTDRYALDEYKKLFDPYEKV
ncbi:MAG: deoxyguanosinetriphosphate triphosphohydrolase [Candidatus Omnitrophota bacterium]|jgi:dGTPase|nr:MAG: deoxyguanosinetriphosphate triphosphohydrolase [Candidatus Omnitrophota bacterium]